MTVAPVIRQGFIFSGLWIKKAVVKRIVGR